MAFDDLFRRRSGARPHDPESGEVVTFRDSGVPPRVLRPDVDGDEGHEGNDPDTEPAPGALRHIEASALIDRPTVRIGIYTWALIGALLVTGALFFALSQVTVVVIPLVLALFPAAILVPITARLQRWLPNGLAAITVLVGAIAILSGLVAVLAPSVADQLGGVADSAREGFDQAQAFLLSGPLGFDPIQVDELVDQAGEQLQQTDGVATGVLGAAAAVAQGLTGTAFLLVALFFYLKDGPKIAGFLRDLFPERFRPDVEEIGSRVWTTVGAYIRGQATIALVDAIAIAIALAVLGVPLVLPLAVLVFFGGLFPIVGAFASGTVAVLVALATTDVRTALLVLAAILIVQQVEGQLLAPIVLGRATEMHPLATISSLAAGAALLGILGAFIAVPIAASLARSIGYLRGRVPG